MKKNLLVVSVAAILVSAMAFAAQGVYGSWAFPAISQGPISFNMSRIISQGTVSMKNLCTFNGQSVIAQVTVPATITDRSIAVLGAGEDHQSKNGVDCN